MSDTRDRKYAINDLCVINISGGWKGTVVKILGHTARNTYRFMIVSVAGYGRVGATHQCSEGSLDPYYNPNDIEWWTDDRGQR